MVCYLKSFDECVVCDFGGYKFSKPNNNSPMLQQIIEFDVMNGKDITYFVFIIIDNTAKRLT